MENDEDSESETSSDEGDGGSSKTSGDKVESKNNARTSKFLPLKCKICPLQLSSRRNFARHRRKHEKNLDDVDDHEYARRILRMDQTALIECSVCFRRVTHKVVHKNLHEGCDSPIKKQRADVVTTPKTGSKHDQTDR